MADFALGVEPGEHPFEGEEIGPDVGVHKRHGREGPSLDPLGKHQLLARDIDESLIDRSFGSCGLSGSDVGHSERHGDLAQDKVVKNPS